MKKRISLMLALVFAFSLLLPAATAFAYDVPKQKGYISSGIGYEGTLEKNDVGNTIPAEYTLVVERNSIVRFQVYKGGTDFTLDVDSLDNPNKTAGTYGVIKGDACTKVDDFNKTEPETYGTSKMGVLSDARNTKPYTEMFTNLMAGTYKIRISGGPDYKFKTTIDPLMFQDDSGTFSNFVRDTALRVEMNKSQDGNLVSNGILNGKYISEDIYKSSMDYYTFYVDRPGFYRATLISDGFFQGMGEVIDQNGKFLADGMINMELSFDGGKTNRIIGTYEQHKAAAGTSHDVVFEAKTSGMFFFQVTKRAFTAGSYQFVINTTAPGVSTIVPSVTPTPTSTTGIENTLNTLKIAPEEISLLVGDTATLKLNGVYGSGKTEDVTKFGDWSSADPRIATVGIDGTVKGIGVGTTTINAQVSGKTVALNVTVREPATKVLKLIPSNTKIYLKVGKTTTNKITAILADGSKRIISGEASMTSSGKAVVIYKKSILKAVKKGTVKITVHYGDISTSYTVVVK